MVEVEWLKFKVINFRIVPGATCSWCLTISVRNLVVVCSRIIKQNISSTKVQTVQSEIGFSYRARSVSCPQVLDHFLQTNSESWYSKKHT